MPSPIHRVPPSGTLSTAVLKRAAASARAGMDASCLVPALAMMFFPSCDTSTLYFVAGVGSGSGSGVGTGSGTGVGSGMGTGTGSGVGTGAGSGVGVGAGAGASPPNSQMG